MKSKSCFSIFQKLNFHLCSTIFLMVIIPLVSCSEDEGPDCSQQGTNLSISDIAGNWTATEANFFNVATDPIQVVDVVAEGGTVTLAIESNGRFRLTVAESGGPNDVSSGDFCFDEDLLVVLFDGDAPDDWEYFRISLNAGTGNLSISGPAEFDFDNNGTQEAGEISLSLVRS